MKKIAFVLSMALITMFISCKKNDYLLYDTDNQRYISFKTDTTHFEYGLSYDLDVEISVSVNVLGMPPMSAEDRFEIGLSYGSETTATEGVEFELKSFIMKDSIDAIQINIFKDKLEYGKEYILVLNIIDNGTFVPTGLSTSYISFGNYELARPVWWKDDQLGIFNSDKLVMFMNLFYKTEETSPVYYNLLSTRFGENLDQSFKPYTVDMLPYMLTTYSYKAFFTKHIKAPMYQHYLTTGDSAYEMPETYE